MDTARKAEIINWISQFLLVGHEAGVRISGSREDWIVSASNIDEENIAHKGLIYSMVIAWDLRDRLECGWTIEEIREYLRADSRKSHGIELLPFFELLLDMLQKHLETPAALPPAPRAVWIKEINA